MMKVRGLTFFVSRMETSELQNAQTRYKQTADSFSGRQSASRRRVIAVLRAEQKLRRDKRKSPISHSHSRQCARCSSTPPYVTDRWDVEKYWSRSSSRSGQRSMRLSSRCPRLTEIATGDNYQKNVSAGPFSCNFILFIYLFLYFLTCC